MVCFLLWDTFQRKIQTEFPSIKKYKVTNVFLCENDYTTYHRVSFNKKEHNNDRYVFFYRITITKVQRDFFHKETTNVTRCVLFFLCNNYTTYHREFSFNKETQGKKNLDAFLT